MKQLKRFLPVLIVIALLAFGPVLAAFAQGTDPLCNGLSDSDYAEMVERQKSLEAASEEIAQRFIERKAVV